MRRASISFCVHSLALIGTPQRVQPRSLTREKPSTYEPIAIATWSNKGFGDDDLQDESNVLEPIDFMWQSLEGRCCFTGGWTEDKKNNVFKSHGTCEECNLWGDPDASCHRDSTACAECGSQLYCPGKPPPLLDAGYVCVGRSRVGAGCEDSLALGVCMTFTLQDCVKSCQNEPQCEKFVYYTQQQLGTCILCSDLDERKPTHSQVTRVYDRVEANPPPSPPGIRNFRYSRLDAPPPLEPPPPLNLVLPPPPKRKQVTFECSFKPEMEVSVDTDVGYIDKVVDSQGDCCQECGNVPGCTDFVFQPNTKVCLLLPHVPAEQLIETPNQFTVSGIVRLKARAIVEHQHCVLHPATVYSGGLLPMQPGDDIGGISNVIQTEQDCCDVCHAVEDCVKFTFERSNKECSLHYAYAEQTSSQSMISGEIRARYGDARISKPGYSAIGLDALHEAWPPLPPTLTTLLPPPMVSRQGTEGGLTEKVMSAVSIFVMVLLALVFAACVSLCFASDVLRLTNKLVQYLTNSNSRTSNGVSGENMGKPGAKARFQKLPLAIAEEGISASQAGELESEEEIMDEDDGDGEGEGNEGKGEGEEGEEVGEVEGEDEGENEEAVSDVDDCENSSVQRDSTRNCSTSTTYHRTRTSHSTPRVVKPRSSFDGSAKLGTTPKLRTGASSDDELELDLRKKPHHGGILGMDGRYSANRVQGLGDELELPEPRKKELQCPASDGGACEHPKRQGKQSHTARHCESLQDCKRKGSTAGRDMNSQTPKPAQSREMSFATSVRNGHQNTLRSACDGLSDIKVDATIANAQAGARHNQRMRDILMSGCD